MKWISYLLMFVFVCAIAQAATITTFTNGLTKENITFTGNGSAQRFIRIPIYANVTSASLIVNNDYAFLNCYQETANVSTICGGLSSGRYSSNFFNLGIWERRMIDGNWSTYGYSYSGYYFINYSVPQGTNKVLWQIKVGDPVNLENLTIPNDCIFNSKIRLAYNMKGVGIDVYCYNSSINKKLLNSYGRSDLYEESIYWSSNNITQPEITVGGTSVYNVAGNLKPNVQINYTTALQSLLPACSCVNCTKTAYNCSIPIKFYSNSSGLFENKNINVVVGSVINIYDELTTNLITGKTVNLEFISALEAFNTTTTTGHKTVNLNQSIYTLRVSSTGYGTRDYTFDLRYNNTINVYLLNTTDATDVTARVYDEKGDKLEGAYISVYRYNLATNSYILMQQAVTNFQGLAILELELNNELYKFEISYPYGESRYISQPTYISSTTIEFSVSITDPIALFYYKLAQITTDLRFSTPNFVWTYSDSNALCDNYCVAGYLTSALNDTLLNSSCSTSTSGTLVIGIPLIGNRSYFAKAYCQVGTNTYPLDADAANNISSSNPFKTNKFSLFIVLIATIFFAFISRKMVIAMILTPLPMFFASMFNFINIPVMYTIGYIILAIVLGIVINRDD